VAKTRCGLDSRIYGIWNKTRRIRCTKHETHMEEKRNPYMVLARRPDTKIPLVRPRQSGQSNIKMDLREMGWGGFECEILGLHKVLRDS
jgi:hypothetical protein